MLAKEIETLEEKLEDIQNELSVIHGTANIIAIAIGHQLITTKELDYVVFGMVRNMAKTIKEIENLIGQIMELKRSI